MYTYVINLMQTNNAEENGGISGISLRDFDVPLTSETALADVAARLDSLISHHGLRLRRSGARARGVSRGSLSEALSRLRLRSAVLAGVGQSVFGSLRHSRW